MVVAIGGEADVIAPLTMDRVSQGYAIGALDPLSTTALHDAIIATLDRLAPEAGRQALIVFSDGIDRYSRATAAQVVERARRSNALIYLIAFGKVRLPLLAELAVITGGRSFLLRDVRELDRTLADVARELRDQYLSATRRPIRSSRISRSGERFGWRSRSPDFACARATGT